MAKIGFVVGEDFEDQEFAVPFTRLGDAGHDVVIIGAEAGKELSGKKHMEKIVTEVGIDDVDADELDALVIPGGYSPDHLRTNEAVVDLIAALDDAGTLIAAVCHGPSLLVDADILDGRTLTSWPSIKNDLINAGAEWIDQQVVEDGNLITSRKPDDLEAFSDAILGKLKGIDADAVDPGSDELQEEARKASEAAQEVR